MDQVQKQIHQKVVLLLKHWKPLNGIISCYYSMLFFVPWIIYLYLCKSIWYSILGNILQNTVFSPEKSVGKKPIYNSSSSPWHERPMTIDELKKSEASLFDDTENKQFFIYFFLNLWKQGRNNISQLHFFIKSIHNSLSRKHHHIPSYCPRY